MTFTRGHSGTGMAALLSRLVLVLALALFGGHRADTHRAVTQTEPVAAGDTAFAPIILTMQSHSVRAHLPEGDPPHPAILAAVTSAQLPPMATPVAWGHSNAVSRSALGILPPVRGPPAV